MPARTQSAHEGYGDVRGASRALSIPSTPLLS
jgi:hypothetical protein